MNYIIINEMNVSVLVDWEDHLYIYLMVFKDMGTIFE